MVMNLNGKTKPLAHLNTKQAAKIIRIHGGHHLKRRLEVMGLREGQNIKILSKQPLRGPLTVSIGNCQMTMGRGMAHKILVEEI
jgi:ferrous iron transport protein A